MAAMLGAHCTPDIHKPPVLRMRAYNKILLIVLALSPALFGDAAITSYEKGVAL